MRKRLVKLAALVLAMLVMATTCVYAAPVIAWGSTGDTVSTIQRRLKQWGYFSGPVTGYFGQQTYTAVVAFQRKNGINPDGVVGSATAAAMGISLGGTTTTGGSPTTSTAGYTTNETDLLARLVYGEARGEPYIGQVAVAAVVLNRVRHASFPNTIAGVIYQAGAFDAVSDGQIWLTPDNNAYRAARDAMNGWDPTYGCIYYYNPATATNAWIWSREIRLSIGRHNFAI